MRISLSTIAFLSLAAVSSSAQTYYKDVLPILLENCVECHREHGANYGGMIAPMSLRTYAQVRPWAKAISRQVQARTMPPWHADPIHHGVFANERSLTDTEIETIAVWVERGALAGNPKDGRVPDPSPERSAWALGPPDLVIRMPEPYLVEDEVSDIRVSFKTRLTRQQLSRDRWVRAVEFRPDSSAVHHFALSPLNGTVPGRGPTVYSEGYGRLLPAELPVTFNMHYHKESGPGTAVWDRSEVGVFFWPKGTVIRYPILQRDLRDDEFEIPPGDPNYSRRAQFVFPFDVRILGLGVHMHLRGKSARFVLEHPDSRQELLLSVPSYDFNWQTIYTFKEPLSAPSGSTLHFKATWDNSESNPANPDPTRSVKYGNATWDEMMLGGLWYVEDKPHAIQAEVTEEVNPLGPNLAPPISISSEGMGPTYSGEYESTVSVVDRATLGTPSSGNSVCLRVKSKDEDRSGLRHYEGAFKLEGGKTYSVSCRILSDEFLENIRLGVYSPATGSIWGENRFLKNSHLFNEPGEWTYFSVRFEVPAGQTDTGFVRVISGARVKATWYVDELSINEVMPEVVLRPVQ